MARCFRYTYIICCSNDIVFFSQNYEDSSMIDEGQAESVEVRSNRAFLESMLSAMKALLDENEKVRIVKDRTCLKCGV